MKKFFLIYITTPNQDEAKHIAKTLVEERLAACVNIFSHVISVYQWENKMNEDHEVVLIAKTTEANVAPLIEKVKTIHSYDCPCIVTVPITAANPDFLSWIEKEVNH